MTLEAVLESIDELDPVIQKEYVEKNGKFYLDVSEVDGFALEDVRGLRATVSKERQNVKEANDRAKEFDGLDSSEVREALEKVKKLKGMAPDAKNKEQIDAQVAQIKAKFDKDLVEKDGLIGELEKDLCEHLISAAAAAAIGDHNPREGGIELLMPHVTKQTRIDKGSDGKRIAKIINSDGTVRVSELQGSTADMEIKELIEVMAKNPTYAPAFDGSGAIGGGTTPKPSQPGGRPGPQKTDPVNPAKNPAATLDAARAADATKR